VDKPCVNCKAQYTRVRPIYSHCPKCVEAHKRGELVIGTCQGCDLVEFERSQEREVGEATKELMSDA
jgi:hypothetical protein